MTDQTIGRDVAHHCPYCPHPFHGGRRCAICPCPHLDDRRRAILRMAEMFGRKRPQQ